MSRGAPKFATRRTPANPSLGAVVGHVSKAVRGKTLMPWQQAVADVGCELNPDYPGEWRYDTVIVTVPRQAGKSDLLGAIHTHRLIAYRNHLAVMTAQTGKDAGKRWRAIAKDIPKDDAARLFEIKRGKGAEYIEYLPSGSSLSPFAPTASAVHGDSLNLATIDEGWAFTEAQGRDVEGAIKPTFATIVNSQLWIVSTRGTANSEWLNNKIALGRASVGDPDSRIAYFEWSADEALADEDPYGDATLAFHPALGHTQTARKLRHLGEDASPGEWRRAYLNLPTETAETALDLAVWDSLRWNYDPEDAPTSFDPPKRPEDVVIAWDAALDGASATIAAAWLDDADNPCVAIAATVPGTAWLRPALTRLAERGYRAIAADDRGVNRTIRDELGADFADLPLTWDQYGTACQSFLDRVRLGLLTHDGDRAVVEAIKVAVLRKSPQFMVIDADKSAGPVDPLRAVALAQWLAADRLRAPVIQLF